MKIETICPCCKKKFMQRWKNQKHCCKGCAGKLSGYKFPKGNKIREGLSPWNKGTLGVSPSNKTSFKKGSPPWNKGTAYEKILWDKHFSFKGGHTAYRKHFLRNCKNLWCDICRKPFTGGHAFHVHHKDRDRKNNKLTNLQLLCSKCHLRLHKCR